MKSHLYALLAGLCLLVGVVAVAFWVRSYWRGDDIGVNTPHHRCFIRTGGGEVALEWTASTAPVNASALQWDVYPDRTKSPYMLRRDTFLLRRGFWASASEYPGGKVYSLLVPIWLPLLVFLSAAIAMRTMARRARRVERVSARKCVACGYDLRGSPERCPECGMIPTPII